MGPGTGVPAPDHARALQRHSGIGRLEPGQLHQHELHERRSWAVWIRGSSPSGYANDLRSNTSGALFTNAKSIGYPISFWQLNAGQPVAGDAEPGGNHNNIFVVDLRDA
jgi:hypothetical protein